MTESLLDKSATCITMTGSNKEDEDIVAAHLNSYGDQLPDCITETV